MHSERTYQHSPQQPRDAERSTELRRYGDLKVVTGSRHWQRLSRWILFPVVIHCSLFYVSLHATYRYTVQTGYTVSIANCASSRALHYHEHSPTKLFRTKAETSHLRTLLTQLTSCPWVLNAIHDHTRSTFYLQNVAQRRCHLRKLNEHYRSRLKTMTMKNCR